MMKTVKLSLVAIAVLIAAGFSQANAQAEQYKDLVWAGDLYIGCINNGQGEWISGLVHQHAVFLYNNDGSLKKMHFNYVESEFVGQSSGEVFTLKGAAKIDWIIFPDLIWKWNETQILDGDKGTKALIRIKFHITPEGELVMDLYFEKCLE